MEPAHIAAKMGPAQAEVNKLLASAAEKLYVARSETGLPKDTKLLAGWHELALRAFAYAARSPGTLVITGWLAAYATVSVGVGPDDRWWDGG